MAGGCMKRHFYQDMLMTPIEGLWVCIPHIACLHVLLRPCLLLVNTWSAMQACTSQSHMAPCVWFGLSIIGVVSVINCLL